MNLRHLFAFAFLVHVLNGVAGLSVSTVVGNIITLSDDAVACFGGNFNDLFGSVTTDFAVGVDAFGNLVTTDLKKSNFLLTGQDPCFNATRDVYFLIYTNGKRAGEVVTAKNISTTSFNASNPTRFLIHGWMNSHTSDINTEITAAYLDNGNFNVIVVDWSFGSADLSYLNARLRINSVSIVIAELINFMITNCYTTYDKVVVVGHSFGGHTAGLTGKKITGGKIKAVIALDPAGPLFPLNPTKGTVQPTDAQYVETIHCNGGGIGMKNPSGQADFFPNGGSVQPDCIEALVCPHVRCYEIFAESISKPNNFFATKCLSYQEIFLGSCIAQRGIYVMGGEPSNSAISGYFYLKTAGGSPYALGKV